MASWIRDRGWRPFPLDHPSLSTCGGLHGPNNPCDGKRGKHPIAKFGTACNVEPADGLINTWFGGKARNVGVACGPSTLFVVDEDEQDALERFAALRNESIPMTYRVRTSRGWHYYFDATEYPQLGNASGLLGDHGMDVRGRGGFVVAAGSLHASGLVYAAEDEHVSPAALPVWIAEAVQTKLDDAGDEVEAGEGRWDSSTRFGTETEFRQQYERRLQAIQHRGNDFRTMELFPAARDGWRMVSLGLISQAEMKKDIGEAIERVFDAPPDNRDKHIVNGEARKAADASPWALTNIRMLDPVAGLAEDEQHSSWQPVDLDALWDTVGEPRSADMLSRSDGVRMFYLGKTHSVHGESESGKSWIGQSAALERLHAGDSVLYVDYEDDASSVLARMKFLGMRREQIPLFVYVSPDGPQDHHFAELLTRSYELAIIDGVTVAMGYAAKKSNDQDEYTQWYKSLPLRIARSTGAGVVQIDHVSKSKDERGRFAIGSQAKMGNISGSAFYVDVVAGFGQGLTGELRIYVGKDRPGGVRAHAGKMKKDRLQPFARYIHNATDPTAIKVSIEPWLEEGAETDPDDLSVAEAIDWRDHSKQPALPDDVTMWAGDGRAALRHVARFMRMCSIEGDGMTRGDAQLAMATLLDQFGKPVAKRLTVNRAWGVLRELGRIAPAKANRPAAPNGLHRWVENPPTES
jgi:hypothetical protein